MSSYSKLELHLLNRLCLGRQSSGHRNLHSTGGRAKRKERGQEEYRELGVPHTSVSPNGPALAGGMESWRGRYTQLTASWASAQEARLPCPLMPSILLRFKRGNVLFISHPPGETWQPEMALIPQGSWLLVTASSSLSAVGALTAF